MTRSNQKQPTDKKPVVANKVAKSELKVIPIGELIEVRGGRGNGCYEIDSMLARGTWKWML